MTSLNPTLSNKKLRQKPRPPQREINHPHFRIVLNILAIACIDVSIIHQCIQHNLIDNEIVFVVFSFFALISNSVMINNIGECLDSINAKKGEEYDIDNVLYQAYCRSMDWEDTVSKLFSKIIPNKIFRKHTIPLLYFLQVGILTPNSFKVIIKVVIEKYGININPESIMNFNGMPYLIFIICSYVSYQYSDREAQRIESER